MIWTNTFQVYICDTIERFCLHTNLSNKIKWCKSQLLSMVFAFSRHHCMPPIAWLEQSEGSSHSFLEVLDHRVVSYHCTHGNWQLTLRAFVQVAKSCRRDGTHSNPPNKSYKSPMRRLKTIRRVGNTPGAGPEKASVLHLVVLVALSALTMPHQQGQNRTRRLSMVSPGNYHR